MAEQTDEAQLDSFRQRVEEHGLLRALLESFIGARRAFSFSRSYTCSACGQQVLIADGVSLTGGLG